MIASAVMLLGAAAGAVEAADIDPGTFAFDTSAPGLMGVSLSKLELEVCGRATSHTGSLGGLTNLAAPGEIIDINANMNIQGMMSNSNGNHIALAPLQIRVVAPVDFGTEGSATADVVASRFCMETVSPVSLSCGDFDGVLALDPTVTQEIGDFVLTADQMQGGSFTSDLELNLVLHLADKRTGTTAQVTHVVSYASSGQWAYAPGVTGVTQAYPLWIDTDCDDVADTVVPGTTDLFPGWTSTGLQTEITFTDLQKGGYLRLEPPLKGQ